TGRCDTAWKVWAPTNRCAASVIATCTVAPASRRRRTSSTALYAAIPPVTHNSTRRPFRPWSALDPAVAMSRKFLTRIRATSLPEPAFLPDFAPALQALNCLHSPFPSFSIPALEVPDDADPRLARRRTPPREDGRPRRRRALGRRTAG